MKKVLYVCTFMNGKATEIEALSVKVLRRLRNFSLLSYISV
jgi:hypothetical protein